jgi:RNA polymerase sigma-70 factor (ECF subfamily)
MPSDAPILPLTPRRAVADLRARPDDELMRLAAAGMLDAFNELVRRYQDRVRRFCARMLGSATQGDDVAQELFLEIWRTRARYEEKGKLSALLFATARNRCLKAARARRSFAPIDGDGSGDGEATAPVFGAHAAADRAEALEAIDAILAAERRDRLERLVRRLPAKLRDVIGLRFWADLDYPEIAAIVKRSEETVRWRVFQGLKRLRQMVSNGKPEERP